MSPPTPRSLAQAPDADVAARAESIELVLVAAYEAVIAVLSEELVPVAETHLAHHRQHAEAFAEVAGDAATGEADPGLLAEITPALENLAGSGTSLRFLQDLEERVVATYVSAAGGVDDAPTITLLATITPVEASHAVALADLVDASLDASFPTGAFEPTDAALGFGPTATAPS